MNVSEVFINATSEYMYFTTETLFNGRVVVENSAEISYRDTARMIHIICRPVLVVLGTIGNVLAFYIMRKGSLRKISTCFYMAILALADTGILWNGAFIAWVRYITDLAVDPNSWTDCKLSFFLFYFCSHYSSALLTIMCIEKLLALYFPTRAKTLCSVKTAKWVSVMAALCILVFDFQFFLVYDVRIDSNGFTYCTWVRVPDNYSTTFYNIDAALYSFAPFAIMILANSAIIFKLLSAKFNRKQNGTSQALSKSATKGTAMLVTVSVMFIILTGPVAFTYATIAEDKIHPLLGAITIILQYLNHSINGLLYCISGSKFRKELLSSFTCLRKNRVQSITMNGISTTASPI